MRFTHITYLCLSLLLIISCKDDTESVTYDYSKDAQIYSISVAATHFKSDESYTNPVDSLLRAQDSIKFAAFSRTKFIIDQVNGSIYNRDSLPYGLNLRGVKLTLSYNSSNGISRTEIFVPDSTKYYEWNGTDSVNFSKLPIRILTTAPHGNIKEYIIDLRIHQIDPDTIIWKEKQEFRSENGEQKVLLLNDTFYAFSVSESAASLYTTNISDLNNSDPTSPNIWMQQTLSGFPLSMKLNSICIMNDNFFAITEEGESYTSSDGINWEKRNNEKTITTLYGVIPGTTSDNNLLLVAFRGENQKYYFGTSRDMSSVDVITKISNSRSDTIQTGFPIKGFSSITNFDQGGYYNTLVLTAGLDYTNKELNSIWLVNKSGNELQLSPSTKNPFFKGDSSSVFLYNNSLYVISNNKMYYSRSWGSTWALAPNKQMLDPTTKKRNRQSVIVDEENNIWIFGGVFNNNNSITYLNDTWRGRLNKLNVN